MNDVLLRMYHLSPASVRSLAASIYGYRLRSWRFGPETDAWMEEALEREHWSPERWRLWQEQNLARVLHHAATHVPYYREQWSKRRRAGDVSSWERLENWPLLDKETVRRNPQAFVADGCNIKRMYLDHTGGTTGTPLKLWSSKITIRMWHAIFESRARRWNNVSRFDPSATLGGQAVVRANAKYPPFWVWNAPMKHLYLSANHISRTNAPHFLGALNSYQIRHIVGYPSSLSVLARETLQLNIKLPELKVIITMAEPITSQQRKVIKAAFRCDIRETYGMGELVAMATECHAGTLHLWPEVGWVETFNDHEDRPVAAGAPGRLVCTSLLNTDMPLVRYAVGDRGRVAEKHLNCGCGRTLPALLAIEGRTNDLLLARDGRKVYWLNPVFYDLPLAEAQIIQENLDQIRILYVPDATFAKEYEELIARRVTARMGTIHVVLEKVSSIPRGANGKFRAVICNLQEHEKHGLHNSASTI